MKSVGLIASLIVGVLYSTQICLADISVTALIDETSTTTPPAHSTTSSSTSDIAPLTDSRGSTQQFSITHLIFRGTATPNSKVFIVNNETPLTFVYADSQGRFKIDLYVDERGKYDFYVYAEDKYKVPTESKIVRVEVKGEPTITVSNIAISPTKAKPPTTTVQQGKPTQYPIIVTDTESEIATSTASSSASSSQTDVSSVGFNKLYIVLGIAVLLLVVLWVLYL